MTATRPFWLQNEDGEAVRFFDQVYTLKASGAATGGSFGLLEITTPQGAGPPPHVHTREDEAFYVLEGRYEVTVGDERFEAAEGTFIFAPRNVRHGYVVRSSRGRHLGFVFPSGFETFFHDFVGAGGGTLDPHRMAQMAKDRGVTLLEPPPGP
jgi:quercetin dioxygenase-like cupin family protein